MDQSWPQYHDPNASNTPRRHNGAQMNPPAQSPAAYPYDQYHAAAAAAANASPSQQPHHPPANQMSSPMGQPRDGNGDVAMRDAHDQHAGIKYPMRPHHQAHLSAGRHDLQQQPSSAAQRYSPMETLSPTSPYGPKTSQFANPPSQTQSPSSAAEYPQSPYYPGRQQQQQQLPPLSPYSSRGDGYPSSAVANLDNAFANAAKSPQRPTGPLVKPVPEFKKIRAVSDLQPKAPRQPPFRRANPEGGFISVRTYCFLAHYTFLKGP